MKSPLQGVKEGDEVLVYADALTAILRPDETMLRARVKRVTKRSIELDTDASSWTINTGRPWGAEDTDLRVAYLGRNLPKKGDGIRNVLSALLTYCTPAVRPESLAELLYSHDDVLTS